MPTILDSATIHEAQAADLELPNLLDVPHLELHNLDVEGSGIFCDISSGVVRPYLPASLRRTAFDVGHAPSHPSGRSTAHLLEQKFYWPGLRKDATRWAKECEPCQRCKVHRHNRTVLGKFTEPDNRFEHIHVDIIKLPLVREHQYCLTVIDRFSRWPVAVPLRDMRADTVARALFDNWICLFGTPLRITSDQGTQFESSLFTSLSRLFGAKHLHTTPYHPQSNGLVERLHRTLKAALMCGAPTPWIDLLPTVLLGIRTAFKEDLQASAAEMLFGTSLRIPGEFFVDVSNPADMTTFLGKIRSLFQAIRPVPASRHTQQKPFVFRDLASCSHVFRRVDMIKKPLEPPYTGPYRVVRRLDNKTFVILVDGVEKAVSADALKPAYMESGDSNKLLPHATSPEPTLKRVLFASPSGEVTEGGVPVAPPALASRRDRRKQHLQPRQLFALASRVL